MTSGNAILEQCAAIVNDFLVAHALVLAEPIGVRFLDTATGSTGVKVSVRLRDGAQADAARRLLSGRFDAPGVDVIDVR
jgi:hypothetical protein